MVATSKDTNLARVRNLVDEAMFLVDAAGPSPRQRMFQRFWLTGAFKRGSNNFADELQDFQSDLPVMFHPPREVGDRI
jgi:hypothetical protein